MYTVGQNILGGKAVVASVDTSGKIVSVEFPSITDQFGTPLGVNYNYGVTEAVIEGLV